VPAFGWAMPMAPWVFVSATLGFVTIPTTRVHAGLATPMAAGTATLIVNGTSGPIQLVVRARSRVRPPVGCRLRSTMPYPHRADDMSLASGLPLACPAVASGIKSNRI
jgi:hypothetical protein